MHVHVRFAAFSEQQTNCAKLHSVRSTKPTTDIMFTLRQSGFLCFLLFSRLRIFFFSIVWSTFPNLFTFHFYFSFRFFSRFCLICWVMEDHESQDERARKRKRPRIPIDKRAKIVLLTLEGNESQRKIARKMHVALSTVQNVEKKWFEYHQLGDLSVPGRPRKVSDRVVREIDLQVMRNRLLTEWDVHQYLIEEHDIVLSIVSVRNMLKRANIRFYSQRPKPELTQQQKLARLSMARKWKHSMPLKKWRKVIFSDEAKIQRAPVRKVGRLLRKGVSKGARGKRSFPKEAGGSIGLWLAISKEGIIAFEIFRTSLKGSGYSAILNKHIPMIAQQHFRNSRFVWQQDNAPIHTAKSSKATLQSLASTLGFDVLPFPAYSPDLSLVENVIHLIKHRLRAIAEKEGEPNDLDELELRVKRVIAFFNKPAQRHIFQSLYDDMPLRVAKVIEAHGDSIER